MSKLIVFESELDNIKSAKFRKATEYLITDILPDRFFLIPPSSTGKYHPICTVREGGLIVHTKRLIFFAMFLADAHLMSEDEKDKFIFAGIAHDLAKKTVAGYKKDKKYTYKEHPVEARDILRKHEEKLLKYMTKGDIKDIYNMVLYHMGPFTDDKTKKDMNKYTLQELIMYHADYLSSKKTLQTPVDAYIYNPRDGESPFEDLFLPDDLDRSEA